MIILDHCMGTGSIFRIVNESNYVAYWQAYKLYCKKKRRSKCSATALNLRFIKQRSKIFLFRFPVYWQLSHLAMDNI